MLLSLLRPEARLLFQAAGGPVNDSAIDHLLTQDLDWVEICQLAEREKAAPIVWRRVKSVAADRVPAGAEAHLRKLARVIQFQMSYLEQLTTKSTAALDQAGIDYSLLKGAALACGVYGSFIERPMVDLDILVDQSQARHAVEALLSVGWLWQRGRPIEGDYSHMRHLPALLDPNGLASVEVHTSLFPPAAPFDIATKAVLESARTARFNGAMVRVPDPVHLLLHACIHFAWGHMFRQGAWRTFRDVQAITTAYDIDWPRFIAETKRHGAQTCCYWTFHLGRELMGVQIPAEVIRAMRPPLPAIALRVLERHLTMILVPSGTGCPSVSLRRAMWAGGILPRWSGHAAVRPWHLLLPEDRPSGEAQLASRRAAIARRSGREWMRYWSSVLMASPQLR